MAVLQDVSVAPVLTREQLLEQRIAQLEGKLANATKPRSLAIKVGAAGGVSVYGLGRFPVTLYQGQWARLLSAKEDILSFIDSHKDQLATKD